MSSLEEKYRNLHREIGEELHRQNIIGSRDSLVVCQIIWRLMQEDLSGLTELPHDLRDEFKQTYRGFRPGIDIHNYGMIGYHVFFRHFTYHLIYELKKFSEKWALDPNETFKGFLQLIKHWPGQLRTGSFYDYLMKEASFTRWRVDQEKDFANVIIWGIRRAIQIVKTNIEHDIDFGVIEGMVETQLRKVTLGVIHNNQELERTTSWVLQEILYKNPKEIIDPYQI